MTLEEKLFKCSILLGIAIGGLKAMHWIDDIVDDDASITPLSDSMSDLIDRLEKGIDEIFYSESIDANK